MQEIILPAKLKETMFRPQACDCVPTAFTEQGRLLQGIVHDPKARVLGKDCGSAGLFSNLEDLIKMTQAYLGLRHDVLPLKQDTLANLFQVETPKNVHPRSWGWDLRFDPVDLHPLIYHTGFTGTFILIDRLNQTAMIVLTNRIHPSGHNHVFLAMREKIVDIFLKENVYKD